MQRIYWVTIPLLATIFAISSALILQYFLNYSPCELCYTQRYIWYATGAVSIMAFYWRKNIFILPILLLIAASIAVSFYQSGMVFEWWTGVTQCGAGQFDTSTIGNLSNLSNLDVSNLEFNVSCSSIDQKLFGFLPLPFANTLFSSFTFILTLFSFWYSQR